MVKLQVRTHGMVAALGGNVAAMAPGATMSGYFLQNPALLAANTGLQAIPMVAMSAAEEEAAREEDLRKKGMLSGWGTWFGNQVDSVCDAECRAKVASKTKEYGNQAWEATKEGAQQLGEVSQETAKWAHEEGMKQVNGVCNESCRAALPGKARKAAEENWRKASKLAAEAANYSQHELRYRAGQLHNMSLEKYAKLQNITLEKAAELQKELIKNNITLERAAQLSAEKWEKAKNMSATQWANLQNVSAVYGTPLLDFSSEQLEALKDMTADQMKAWENFSMERDVLHKLHNTSKAQFALIKNMSVEKILTLQDMNVSSAIGHVTNFSKQQLSTLHGISVEQLAKLRNVSVEEQLAQLQNATLENSQYALDKALYWSHSAWNKSEAALQNTTGGRDFIRGAQKFGKGAATMARCTKEGNRTCVGEGFDHAVDGAADMAKGSTKMAGQVVGDAAGRFMDLTENVLQIAEAPEEGDGGFVDEEEFHDAQEE